MNDRLEIGAEEFRESKVKVESKGGHGLSSNTRVV